jgi:carbon monoxide dehydrogenase subunit G
VAIEIREKFQVNAPIDVVWRFVLDPHNVAACMPGAALEQVIDERTFVGTIKVKVGAVMAGYKGKVELTEVDEAAYVVRMKAEGNESGGGTAKGLMLSRLTTLADGGTEVIAEASVDLTGKLMQVGRGMIQGVSKQLFQQFVTRARAQIETIAASEAAAATPATTDSTGAGTAGAVSSATGSPSPASSPRPLPPVPPREDAIAVLPLLLRTLWAGIAGFFRRLFGRADGMR